ncbi:uncharacterized protein BX663DRAFT_491129 [Cokeromyces recurvatus]|uniref:uncharacterized protein n=1 Tax=Cokeromyces recurvatus TaxID=90255 RepID=UPI0022204D5C|nr:uncharacterized protein BX663DRAFT_491129 [Cokeromyces recurvatus]KAI7907508.1 hypothetical protein BX663DRAFT_491129 [Cokeromyces recurvatus]
MRYISFIHKMLSDNTCSLSVELLPEFGWSINNKSIYGPCSVFQGNVKLNIKSLDLVIKRVRLVFHAFETILPFDISPGIIRATKENIFCVQHILWESNEQALTLNKRSEYSFPFIVQMPLIQFPPSVNHPNYQCDYQIIAILDTPSSLLKGTSQPIRTFTSILYMPFIDTTLLKSPFMAEAQKGPLSVKVRMHTCDYVPNDSLSLYIRVDSSNNKTSLKKRISGTESLSYVSIKLKLIQIMHVVAFDDISDQTRVITTKTHKLLLINTLDNQQSSYCEADLKLAIPADITPSYDYGRLVRFSYRLQINVEQKRLFGGIWNYNVRLNDIPITIGTLGYGIKSSSDLEAYSVFQQEGSDTNLKPKFIKVIEYEDALPIYDPSQLPSYESFISNIPAN